MGRFDAYNIRMTDRLRNEWLDDDRSATCECSKCRSEAEVEVGGDYYCLSCARDEFHTCAEENEYCDCCGDELDDYYKVGNEKYCDSCFEQIFRI